MAATDIKLSRKHANVPDFGRNLTILYREKNFPLMDSDGNILYSDQLDGSGNLIPQYYDFPVTIQIPSPIPAGSAAKQALIDTLKAQADIQAQMIAQARANNIVDENKIDSIVKAINNDSGVFFNGTFDPNAATAKLTTLSSSTIGAVISPVGQVTPGNYIVSVPGNSLSLNAADTVTGSTVSMNGVTTWPQSVSLGAIGSITNILIMVTEPNMIAGFYNIQVVRIS